jgi:hypothetical protein
MAKLVDVPDLGSGAARRVGSSPIIRTKTPISNGWSFFIWAYPPQKLRSGFPLYLLFRCTS